MVGYAIRRAQILIYEDFLAGLAPWEITPQRFSALTLVAKNPDLKLTDLARILGIARSGAVQLVNQLEAMGYVRRGEVAGDKRAYALTLTAAGRRAHAAITQAVRAHDARISARLNDAERKQLIALLDRLG